MNEIEQEEIRSLDGPLSYGKYVHCLFVGCVFDERDFSGSSFHECRFQDCMFNQVDLTKVRLCETEFSECKLIGMDFSLCDPLLFSPIFNNCKLYRCSYFGMKLKAPLNFFQCNMDECDFSEAKIPNSSFKECRLQGTTFHNTDLTKCNFRDATEFYIDVTQNKINQCKFSTPEVLSLLNVFNLEIV